MTFSLSDSSQLHKDFAWGHGGFIIYGTDNYARTIRQKEFQKFFLTVVTHVTDTQP